MKIWKTWAVVDGNKVTLDLQEVSPEGGLGGEYRFSALSGLTVEDLDSLISRLTQEKVLLEKLKKAMVG